MTLKEPGVGCFDYFKISLKVQILGQSPTVTTTIYKWLIQSHFCTSHDCALSSVTVFFFLLVLSSHSSVQRWRRSKLFSWAMGLVIRFRIHQCIIILNGSNKSKYHNTSSWARGGFRGEFLELFDKRNIICFFFFSYSFFFLFQDETHCVSPN